PVRLGPRGRTAALALEIIFLSVSVVLPFCALLMVSLSPLWTGTFQPGRMTLANFSYVLFTYRLTQTAFGNSLFLSIVGATIGVSIGALQAYWLHNRRGVIHRMIAPVLSLPR